MATPKQKLIVVVGPTASGKTNLAIGIAKKYGGEIISADSRQVYRKLDIGTAKVTKEEMLGVPHHLIDIVDINTVYTAANFKQDAKKAIKQIADRGNLPVIAGGTFFYVDMLIDKIAPAAVKPNPELRATLENKPAAELFAILQEKDPRRAKEIDPNNKRRLVRALEIVAALGAVPTEIAKDSPYDVLMIGIRIDREDLRARLAARAEDWLTIGFLDEVKSLLHEGVSRERLQEIGFEYQLGVDLLDGKLTKDEFIEVFVQKNWQYAKRQLTWLKRDRSINWVTLADKREVDLLIKQFLLSV